MKTSIAWYIFLFLQLCWMSVHAQHQAKSKSKNLNLGKVQGTKPRNVVFILTDDHRYDFMGFTGKLPWQKTPNMDRLYKEGAWCRNAFVTTSLCSPSRASILTGAYSHVHTIVDNAAPEPQGNVYFPEYLQKAGYQTAFLGKWHMGEEASADNPRPGKALKVRVCITIRPSISTASTFLMAILHTSPIC
jgi:N-acetylglucosamine-6-sulfatase